eukprot:4514337-Pyramimonas_sp.AAC.1
MELPLLTPLSLFYTRSGGVELRMCDVYVTPATDIAEPVLHNHHSGCTTTARIWVSARSSPRGSSGAPPWRSRWRLRGRWRTSPSWCGAMGKLTPGLANLPLDSPIRALDSPICA